MRFYCNMSDGACAFYDGEGEVHETISRAIEAAGELANALFLDSENWHDFQVCVVDDGGNEVARIAVAPAKRPPPSYFQ